MLFTAVPLALLFTEPRLEREPVSTLLWTALALCAAQMVRAVLSRGLDAYSAVLVALLAWLLVPIVALLLVAFGAPVITLQRETLAAAAVLSTLVLQPLLAVYGLDSATWKQLVGFTLPVSDVWVSSAAATIGAWLGAVPIALDWDRTWQAYPITIVMGAYAGLLVGQLGGLFVARARAPSVKSEKPKAKAKVEAKETKGVKTESTAKTEKSVKTKAKTKAKKKVE